MGLWFMNNFEGFGNVVGDYCECEEDAVLKDFLTTCCLDAKTS